MATTSGDQINQWYSKYLGENIAGDPTRGAQAWDAWSSVDPASAEAGIANSPEAQAYKASHPAQPQPTQTSPQTPPTTYQMPSIMTAQPTPAASNAPANNTPFLNSLQGALTSTIGSLSDPNNAGVNSPWVQPAIQANRIATQRGLQSTNDSLAEQAAANGTLHSGGFDVAKQRAAEDASANQANFAGSAVQNQSGLNLGALTNLLGVGGGQLQSANSTLLGQQGLANQWGLGQGQLGLGTNQLNENARQANNGLGYNYAALINAMNNQSYNAAANGG